ncbi:hypothetical protein pb186bvf_019376 [Paramecium bursaria]
MEIHTCFGIQINLNYYINISKTRKLRFYPRYTNQKNKLFIYKFIEKQMNLSARTYQPNRKSLSPFLEKLSKIKTIQDLSKPTNYFIGTERKSGVSTCDSQNKHLDYDKLHLELKELDYLRKRANQNSAVAACLQYCRQ